MYLKFIGIKNIGAIEELKIEPGFTNEGNPKPIVIVGENGTGKTVFLSSIMDSFYEIAGELFDNVAKRENIGRHFYKVKGTPNLRVGSKSGFVAIRYQSNEWKKGIEYIEYINATDQEILNIKDGFKTLPAFDGQSTGFRISLIDDYGYPTISPQERELLQREWHKQAHYYQPAYRYEEPFWKNPVFFERFENTKRVSNHYYKAIEELTSLDENRSFIVNIILDRMLSEKAEERNRNEVILNKINSILKVIKQDNAIRLGVSNRLSISRLGIAREDSTELYLPSINCLSLGESVLLNFFINILRHTDQLDQYPKDACGIVVIDEVDIHLHSELQSRVLPPLIKLFPKIQFILTTHSPLFVLGMQREFGDDGFDLFEMPTGAKITAERFREFGRAYETFTQTKKFEDDLKANLETKMKAMSKPKVYVEGKTDVQYIKKALELYKRNDLLQKIDFEQIGYESENGTKNGNDQALFAARRFLESKPSYLIHKVLILHDPETKNVKCGWIGEERKLKIDQMPTFENHPIRQGIEHLFSTELIENFYETQKHNEKILSCIKKDGITVGWEIRDKQKFCNWICENGTKESFEHFEGIIKILDHFLMALPEKH